MTEQMEKIKSKVNEWLWAIVLVLAGYIATIVSYQAVKTDNRLENMEMKMSNHDAQIIELNNAVKNLIEAYNLKANKDDKQDAEILELWKSTRRSGNGSIPTLK